MSKELTQGLNTTEKKKIEEVITGELDVTLDHYKAQRDHVFSEMIRKAEKNPSKKAQDALKVYSKSKDTQDKLTTTIHNDVEKVIEKLDDDYYKERGVIAKAQEKVLDDMSDARDKVTQLLRDKRIADKKVIDTKHIKEQKKACEVMVAEGYENPYNTYHSSGGVTLSLASKTIYGKSYREPSYKEYKMSSLTSFNKETQDGKDRLASLQRLFVLKVFTGEMKACEVMDNLAKEIAKVVK